VSFRTPTDIRRQAWIGYAAALLLAVLAAYLAHGIFAGAGEAGFNDLNPGGIIEVLAFAVAFSWALLGARKLLRLPAATLLSVGLIVPPSASEAARPARTIEGNPAMAGVDGMAVLLEHGRPVGLFDPLTGRITDWEKVTRVPSTAATTELRGLLGSAALVVVADGENVRGVITRDMYLAGLGQ
jgi:hypothetical protein